MMEVWMRKIEVEVVKKVQIFHIKVKPIGFMINVWCQRKRANKDFAWATRKTETASPEMQKIVQGEDCQWRERDVARESGILFWTGQV